MDYGSSNIQVESSEKRKIWNYENLCQTDDKRANT